MSRESWWRGALLAVIAVGALLRAAAAVWSDPWGPHHPDEHILPLEAIALWEGVTPREVGWPASTLRVPLSAISGAELLWQRGGDVWRARARPDAVVQIVAQWIGAAFVHPSLLYKTGRAVSIVAGIVQLMALAWALSQWTGLPGTVIGTLATALSPVAVSYSQYVLADIAGLLFSTAIVGLAAAPTPGGVIAMGALAGLAAASKFHFGLWFIVPVIAAWTMSATKRARLSLALAASIVGAATVVAAVPWIWTNPPLAAKEVLGVVGAKLPGSGGALRVWRNAITVGNGLGIIVIAGMIGAAIGLDRRILRPLSPLIVVIAVGAAALVSSGVVVERYALVLFPAAVAVAAIGWQTWLDTPRARGRVLMASLLAICIGVNVWSLARSQRIVAETDVDVLVRDWILAEVPAGSRIAVHDEMNAFVPRTVAQLRDCAAFVDTPAAYERKWSIEGFQNSSFADEPMRAMLLNDEQFDAYWCRRELLAHQEPSFYVIRYHDAPRFGAVLEQNALAEFASGSQTVTGGIDVLVTNRDVDVGVRPVRVFETARGRRVVYRRSASKHN